VVVKGYSGNTVPAPPRLEFLDADVLGASPYITATGANIFIEASNVDISGTLRVPVVETSSIIASTITVERINVVNISSYNMSTFHIEANTLSTNVLFFSSAVGENISTNAAQVGTLNVLGIQVSSITALAGDIALTATTGAINMNAFGGDIALTATDGTATLQGNQVDITFGTAGLNLTGGSAIYISGGIATDTHVEAGANLILNANASMDITMGQDLLLSGSNIQSTAFGTGSGQYLRINLNGTYYKIQLLEDV
jgi:hypothetical protein